MNKREVKLLIICYFNRIQVDIPYPLVPRLWLFDDVLQIGMQSLTGGSRTYLQECIWIDVIAILKY